MPRGTFVNGENLMTGILAENQALYDIRKTLTIDEIMDIEESDPDALIISFWLFVPDRNALFDMVMMTFWSIFGIR